MKSHPEIDLRDIERMPTLRPIRKLLYMVFLLALKDKASEVRFEPHDYGCMPSYRVNGIYYDMVPAKVAMMRVIADIKRLAKLGIAHHPLTHLQNWLARMKGDRFSPLDGWVRVLLDGEETKVRVSIQDMPAETSPVSQCAVITLPESPSEMPGRAGQLLKRYLETSGVRKVR